MNKPLTALFLIAILGITGVGLFFLVNSPNTPPTENHVGDVSISEIFYNAEDFQDDFVELYIWSNDSIDISDWTIKDFDGWESKIPRIANIKEYTYIAIYLGHGTNDLDASDLSAKVYLNLNSDVLDNADEVGLYDTYGRLVDFVRYNGGNSNVNYGNWSATDNGPVASQNESIQLFGNDTESSENWMSSVPTPAGPNKITFDTGTGVSVDVYNGIYTYEPMDKPTYRGVPPYDIRGHGVNASTLKMIKEHINFTINFYKSMGFPSPVTNANGKIVFKVNKNNEDGTEGSSNAGALVKIHVGKKANKYELKVCVEHELMHLVQWHKSKNADGENIDNMPHPYSSNNWFEEGMAEYWGRRSTMKNYNVSMKFVEGQLLKVHTANWYENARDTNTSVFTHWKGTWDDYEMSAQFIKFLSEKYGDAILKQIQAAAENNRDNITKSISCKQALEKVMGKSMSQILSEFYKWKVFDRENGEIPKPKIHANFTIGYFKDGHYVGATQNETAAKGGALVQQLIINTTNAVDINTYVTENGRWRITYIEILKDGTNRTVTVSNYGTSSPHRVDGKVVKKVIIIKMREPEDTSTGQINISINEVYGSQESPANALLGFPFYGSLPYSESSPSMWLNITIPENKLILGELYGTAGTSFAFNVYSANMTLIGSSRDTTPSGTYPQVFEFNSTFSEYYYIEVVPEIGSGDFNITFSVETQHPLVFNYQLDIDFEGLFSQICISDKISYIQVSYHSYASISIDKIDLYTILLTNNLPESIDFGINNSSHRQS